MEKIVKMILEQENILYDNIIKSKSGFTNLVYFVDDNLVIKISRDNLTKNKLIKETSIYKNIKLDFIPKYISSGQFKNHQYLITSRLKGNTLYNIWHKLNDFERKDCIMQIANILKSFHNQNVDFLDKDCFELNWPEYISNELKEISSNLKRMGFNTTVIQNFILNELSSIFSKNKFGLVFNDAHFDNFIYNNGKVYLIDFDRARYCPIDYEMLIFKTMCDYPVKFASEDDEEKIYNEDFSGIYELFKVEYEEMFVLENIDKRIAIYQFNYLMRHAIKSNDTDLINKLLTNFNNN